MYILSYNHNQKNQFYERNDNIRHIFCLTLSDTDQFIRKSTMFKSIIHNPLPTLESNFWFRVKLSKSTTTACGSSRRSQCGNSKRLFIISSPIFSSPVRNGRCDTSHLHRHHNPSFMLQFVWEIVIINSNVDVVVIK